MKLAWLTDAHLDSAHKPAKRDLADQLRRCGPDALLMSGDLGEADRVAGDLEWLADAANCPVYFVLGNHDFYGGSIPRVREDVGDFLAGRSDLVYLTGASVVTLCPGVGLVGHDGWGDGRLGRPMETPVRLRDFHEIEELRWLEQEVLVERLKALGTQAAQTLEPALSEGLKSHEHMVVVTHVPPWEEAAWHEGEASDGDWSPYFVCHAMGQMLERVAAEFEDRHITVLCGHTHGGGEVWIRRNLWVRTGAAEYGKPALQAPIFIRGSAW